MQKTFCRKIYVTDDNPRKENPKKIREDIIAQLKGTNYFNIGNRSKAIKEAISNAAPNEIILIAGKGHENYQDYGNKVFSISDKAIIKNFVKSKRNNLKEIEYLNNSKILNKILGNTKSYKFEGLSIDSRDIKKNNLFLALKGKKSDGNKFINISIKKGAKYIVSSKKCKKINRYIKVDNVNKFLNKFAMQKRDLCNATILAITGSAGKTSLKNMLYVLLKRYGKTLCISKIFQ